MLVASWQRSATIHRRDPAEAAPPRRLSDLELRQVRQRMEPVIAASGDILDHLHRAVGGNGCCVLLSDAQGVPVDRRGFPGDDDTFRHWGLWLGNDWSEAAEGTNGIGTAIAEKRSVIIHADQHFHSRNTGLSCMSAPIFGPDGGLMAVLDVSSCRADLTAELIPILSLTVSWAAKRIEVGCFRNAFPAARLMAGPGQPEDVMLAINRDELVVGATRAARHAYNITDTRIAQGLPAALLFEPEWDGGSALSRAEQQTVKRALAEARGNASAAARKLGVSRATLYRMLKRANSSAP